MGALDLSGLRDVINDLFLADKGTLTRTNGVADDDLDEESGDLTPKADAVLYEDVGAVQPVAGSGRRGVADLDNAVVPLLSDTTHRLLLPLLATTELDIQVGDEWKVTDVHELLGDPALVGHEFIVNELPDPSSFAVVRIVFLKPKYAPVQPDPEPEIP